VQAAREVLARVGTDAGHIFNLGHGVLPSTDPDVLSAVVKVVHDEGKAGVR
jgi:uroporphyrinogen decarboxylase